MFVLLTLTTSFVSGIFVEVAWKNGMVIFAMNVPSALVSLMISLLPFAITPLTCFVLPLLAAFAPTMFVPLESVMNGAPGEARSWFAVRSMAYLKFLAVTLVPSLKTKPGRIVKVYTLPFFDTVNFEATSGISLLPAGPFLSG